MIFHIVHIIYDPVVPLHDMPSDGVVSRYGLHDMLVRRLDAVGLQDGSHRPVDLLKGSHPRIHISQEIVGLIVGVLQEVLRLVEVMSHLLLRYLPKHYESFV